MFFDVTGKNPPQPLRVFITDVMNTRFLSNPLSPPAPQKIPESGTFSRYCPSVSSLTVIRCVRVGEGKIQRVGDGFQNPVRGERRAADGVDAQGLVVEDRFDHRIRCAGKVAFIIPIGKDRDVGDPAAFDGDGNLRFAAEAAALSGIGTVCDGDRLFRRFGRFLQPVHRLNPHLDLSGSKKRLFSFDSDRMHRSHSREHLLNCDWFLYAFHTRILVFFDGIIIQTLPKTKLKRAKTFFNQKTVPQQERLARNHRASYYCGKITGIRSNRVLCIKNRWKIIFLSSGYRQCPEPPSEAIRHRYSRKESPAPEFCLSASVF